MSFHIHVIRILLYLGLIFPLTNAGFGDLVDPTYNCPAATTCPIVCVPTLQDCPASLSCQLNTKLCLDGKCHRDCDDADASFDPLANPCPFQCAPVACPKTDDYYDQCLLKYESFYNFSNTCGALELLTTVPVFTLREPAFLMSYTIIGSISILMFVWCAFNQRRSPVPGSTQPLLSEKHNGDDISMTNPVPIWTQTGYIGLHRHNLIGSFLYLATMINLFGLQVFLAMMTFWYYVQQDRIPSKKVFQSETQICKIFIIIWVVAFALTFMLKWPVSIQSLFYRRAYLKYATHVAVYTPLEVDRTVDDDKGVQNFLSQLQQYFHSIMTFIFSEVHMDRRTGEVSYCRVHCEQGNRFFYFRLRRYTYDPSTSMFVPGSIVVGETLGDFISLGSGLSTVDVITRRQVVGYNSIYIRKPFLPMNILREFSKPFYTYQLFLVWAWIPFNFYYMAIVQGTIIVSGGLTVAFFLYRNERNLYRLSYVEGNVQILSNGIFHTASQRDLVPGDIVQVSPGPIYADMVLLQGTDVLVDESALTGESTPMAKTAIDPVEAECKYNLTLHKRYSILAGTTVTEVGGVVLALVTKTGSYTAKGELLRDVLSFRRHKFKFDTQVKLVLLILLCYAIVAFTICVSLLKDYFVFKYFYGMYIVGTALPPLLPTVFTVSVGVSDDRLARKRIACSNSDGILVAGKINMAFFDKTGTLTRQGLDYISASHSLTYEVDDGIIKKPSPYLKMGMASCHSLTTTATGVIVGNQVDINMFEASRGTFDGTDKDGHLQIQVDGDNFTILKRFDFDHHRMVMSVVVKDLSGNVHAIVKGSGESIKRLSMNVPITYDKFLEDGARKGIYQIAMATKTLSHEILSDLSAISRDVIEKDLSFVGIINFKNLLREESPYVIRELSEGGIVSAIITGDSVLTGVCIARECGIIKSSDRVILGKGIDSSNGSIIWVDDNDDTVMAPSQSSLEFSGGTVLAVTGSVWDVISKKSKIESIGLAQFIRVYGRCTPINKADIITAFVEKGHVCCMVGDGGNDCGALKTAHVGIALSDADASIVSPFTSLNKSITAVVDVIKEGRCALASAFSAYKYMIIYGQIETMTQLICAYFSISLSEWCWLFMDGVWMMTMAFSLPLAQAHETLSPKLPTSDLLGIHTMSSALGVLLINVTFTLIALFTLWNAGFFKCRRWNSTDVSDVRAIGDNYEASVLFLVTGYQYISSAMAFNYGYSYRAPFMRNRIFVSLALGFTVIHFFIIVYPSNISCLWRVNCTNNHVQPGITSGFSPLPLNNPFNTTVMPIYFRWILVGIIICNTISVQSWEYYFINGLGIKWKDDHQQSNLRSNPVSDLVDPVVHTESKVGENYDLELATIPIEAAEKT